MKCINEKCLFFNIVNDANCSGGDDVEYAEECMRGNYCYFEPADLPEAGASAERICSVMHSNATEIDDLKCCGNCLHRSTLDMGNYSDETCNKDHNTSSWQYCKLWEYDNIKRDGRTEGFNV